MRIIAASALAILAPALAIAHPGPDGHLHGLDLPVPSLGAIAVSLIVGIVAWCIGRRFLARRDARPRGVADRPDAR